MKLIVPSDRGMHRPFRIGDGVSTQGPRLGGRAPAFDAGVTAALPAGAEYFLTFPLAVEPGLFASLFLNAPFDELLEARNAGFMTDDRIILLTHGEVPRAGHTRHQSPISPHPIILLPEAPDLISDGEGGFIFDSGHKVGGQPYCIQEPELPGAADLFTQGLAHVLQLDFPGARDGGVKGSWPFGDGLFNIFWRPPFEGCQPHWYWQG
jgi:hypothetical protein